MPGESRMARPCGGQCLSQHLLLVPNAATSHRVLKEPCVTTEEQGASLPAAITRSSDCEMTKWKPSAFRFPNSTTPSSRPTAAAALWLSGFHTLPFAAGTNHLAGRGSGCSSVTHSPAPVSFSRQCAVSTSIAVTVTECRTETSRGGKVLVWPTVRGDSARRHLAHGKAGHHGRIPQWRKLPRSRQLRSKGRPRGRCADVSFKGPPRDLLPTTGPRLLRSPTSVVPPAGEQGSVPAFGDIPHPDSGICGLTGPLGQCGWSPPPVS